MRIFILIWFGQLISLIGSGLTSFALGVWGYQKTGSATQFALISLFTTLPRVVISPLAGVLVDRFNRRWIMIISDFGTGLSIVAIALLLAIGRLEIWQIYLVATVSNSFSAFHLPAYTASITQLVPPQYLNRASGMIQLTLAVAQLISPVLGSLLLITIKLQGVILLDFVTFFFALITLLLVKFPNTKTTVVEKFSKTSLLYEMSYALSYITTKPGLFGLLIFFAATNFLFGALNVLTTPLVLSFASLATLGKILSIGGIGMVTGSLVMSTWGRKLRGMYGVFGFMLLGGLCILVAGLRPSVPLFSVAAVLFFFGLPIIEGSIQVIFQKKVPPYVQGRVFALNGAIAQASMSLAYVIAGPLTDKVFEPLMTSNSPLTACIGRIIGVGRGRGIGLLFIVMGALTMLGTVVAYQYPRLRRVENELPDAITNDATALGENQG
ncbi:MAG: MFS transporter [Rhizonema sp. NSF051]|nr:MFS transporter [Rhizonema sp. NSF051]